MIFGFFALREGMTEVMYRIREEMAKGGAAEVTVGETPVNNSDAPDNLYSGTGVDYAKREGRGFEVYKGHAAVIKKHGAIAMIQIFHAGHAKDPSRLEDKTNPWGPMGFVREDGVTVEAFDAKKMKKVRDDFVACSRYMKAAGFDGVTIHGGHGFLFTQFLSPSMNRRTDEYGGNLLNRGRFPREILGDIKRDLGPDFIVELRINGADLVEGGTTPEQTAEFCSTLDGMVDIVHISSGFKSLGYITQEFTSHYEPHGVHIERAAIIKEKSNIPVTVVGGINDPEFAEKAIAEGKVDFVSLARQMIADPEFPNKAREGRDYEIRRCIRCYHCYGSGGPPPASDNKVSAASTAELSGRGQGGSWKCTINPRASNEVQIDKMPAPQGSRRVLVVGGGPGGMQAAITACDRGHRVTLIEKEGSLGGVLKYTDHDIHKVDLKNFKNLLIGEVGRREIEVWYNTEATPDLISGFGGDAVILAIGASPGRPNIPGIDNAIHSSESYNSYGKVGKKVVVIGGGLRGCETAINLADKECEVTIVEMLDSLAYPAGGMVLDATMYQLKKRCNIDARTSTKCTEITPQGVKIEDGSGKSEVIECDTVVYSHTMNAKRPEVERLHAAAGKATVFEVGDCVRGANVYEAVSEGFMAAMKIT